MAAIRCEMFVNLHFSGDIMDKPFQIDPKLSPAVSKSHLGEAASHKGIDICGLSGIGMVSSIDLSLKLKDQSRSTAFFGKKTQTTASACARGL